MERFIIASSRPEYHQLVAKLNRLGLGVFSLATTSEELQALASKIKPSKIFFPHWSSIIADDIFNQYESIIFHMTDVPFGRGGSPLQNLIVRGHKDTKLTALRCEKGLDTGPIYLKKDLDLSGTARQIFARCERLIEQMIIEIIRQKPVPREQEGEPTVFKRRKPEESDLSGLDDLNKVYDYIRMLDADGYPAAYLETSELKFEFSEAELKENEVVARVRIHKKS